MGWVVIGIFGTLTSPARVDVPKLAITICELSESWDGRIRHGTATIHDHSFGSANRAQRG